ncbi:MAG: aldo/keto reductase, partial [Clostridia bacterium]|nr:aldo/keto reductase [Clostridia bacterium]
KAWLTDKNGRAYNRLTALAAETDLSLAMLSLGYLLAQPETIPVMTVSRTEQLEELNAVAEAAWDTAMFAE